MLLLFGTPFTMRKRTERKNMWTKERIKELRKQYGEKQDEFRHRLGITLSTLRCWEQGQGQPSGSAQILLDRLEEDFLSGNIRDLNSDKQPA
jgi:DNA-binding transcriptional regulator YiaG